MATLDRVVASDASALAAGPDLLVQNIGQLCTLDASKAGPRRGPDLDDLAARRASGRGKRPEGVERRLRGSARGGRFGGGLSTVECRNLGLDS
ncbi:hypothetical protein HGA89_07425 [bacterium]|nr:hypothetical protein [bacterium]